MCVCVGECVDQCEYGVFMSLCEFVVCVSDSVCVSEMISRRSRGCKSDEGPGLQC